MNEVLVDIDNVARFVIARKRYLDVLHQIIKESEARAYRIRLNRHKERLAGDAVSDEQGLLNEVIRVARDLRELVAYFCMPWLPPTELVKAQTGLWVAMVQLSAASKEFGPPLQSSLSESWDSFNVTIK